MEVNVSCIHCKKAFSQRDRGYDRFSLNRQIGNQSLCDILDIDNNKIAKKETEYLCGDCFRCIRNIVNTKAKLEQFESEWSRRGSVCFLKRKTPPSTPSPISSKKRLRQDTGVCKNATKGRPIIKEQIGAAIKKSRYGRAIRLMVTHSPLAKCELKRFISQQVRQEMTKYCSSSKLPNQELSRESLEKFCWSDTLDETREHLPTLHAVIEAALTKTTSKHQLTINEGKMGSLVPGLGFLVMVILHLKRRRRFTFLQRVTSVLLYKNGCSQKVLNILNKVGVCLNITGTRGTVGRLCREFDTDVFAQKKHFEQHIRKSADSQTPEKTLTTTMVTRRALFTDTSDQISTSMGTFGKVPLREKQTKCVGYALCWDNVQKMAYVRHSSSVKPNQFLLWALAYCVGNRVPFEIHETETNHVSAPDSLLVSTFIPNKDDMNILRQRMEVIIGRVICRHLDHFSTHYSDCVVKHIQHSHSDVSSKKSHVVTLGGVMKENPATGKGVIAILKHLKKYIPIDENDRPVTILCHGDQLSVERMVDARLAMATSEKEIDRLSCFEPTGQEFHKRCLLLQDTLNAHYKEESVADIGSLYNLRTVFGHRNLRKCVMDNVNQVYDFLEFVTASHVALMAMNTLEMATQSSDPTTSPATSSLQIRLDFFRKLCATILDAMWPELPTSDFADLMRCDDQDCTKDDDDPTYCICDSSTEISSTTFIECAAKTQCLRVRWYHASCLNLPDNLDDSEWFCSDDCVSRSPYCCGDNTKDSKWVGCESGAFCQTGEWFHVGCIGLVEIPDNDWYCSKACEEANMSHLSQIMAKKDHSREYSCAITWRGIFHLAMVDAERENDGAAMMVHWKINMVDFWNNGHYKYLILGHRLLSGINGTVLPRLQHDLMWNRTANLAGGPGHNLALDLVNEFLNNEFKENLKHRRGQYTDSQVEISSRITGTVGKALEDVYGLQIVGKYIPKSKPTRAKYDEDVKDFLVKYNNTFDVIPGREMKSFPKFVNIFTLKRPKVLNTRLSRYCSDLQSEFDVVPDHDDD